MKLLSSWQLTPIAAGEGSFKFLAQAIIETVKYGFDQWKASRERKYAKYQELCIVELPASEKPNVTDPLTPFDSIQNL
jgi:hypothetical protein